MAITQTGSGALRITRLDTLSGIVRAQAIRIVNVWPATYPIEVKVGGSSGITILKTRITPLTTQVIEFDGVGQDLEDLYVGSFSSTNVRVFVDPARS